MCEIWGEFKHSQKHPLPMINEAVYTVKLIS